MRSADNSLGVIPAFATNEKIAGCLPKAELGEEDFPARPIEFDHRMFHALCCHIA